MAQPARKPRTGKAKKKSTSAPRSDARRPASSDRPRATQRSRDTKTSRETGPSRDRSQPRAGGRAWSNDSARSDSARRDERSGGSRTSSRADGRARDERPSRETRFTQSASDSRGARDTRGAGKSAASKSGDGSRSYNERRRTADDRPRTDRPRTHRRAEDDRPRSDRPRGERRTDVDRPRSERARTGGSRDDRPRDSRPRSEQRTDGARPRVSRPRVERQGAEDSRAERRVDSDRSRGQRESRPHQGSGDGWRPRHDGQSRENRRRHASLVVPGGKAAPKFDDHIEPSAYAPDGFVSNQADEMLSFADAGVHPALVAELIASGITQPFPIQAATLPLAITGRDILGRGQTGSGKTLAFGLAMLTQFAQSKPVSGRPMGLVLSPTRELAMQSAEVLKQFGDAVRVRTQLIAGGMSYDRQITSIRQGVHILVATPGRLLDLVNRGSVDLSGVRIAVLDEADQMADMGFLPDVRAILDQVKPQGQRMLFSATLDRGVDTIVDDYLKDPSVHAVDGGQASVSAMSHYLLVLNPGAKDEIIAQIGARKGKTIMFARSQLGAERVGEQLMAAGVPTGVLHGGKSQRVRNRTLEMFKSGICRVLVATDVAARGIHVDDVSLVLQIDLPNNSKDYLHRAGRTARAGEAGVVVALTTTRQRSKALALLKRADVSTEPVYVTPMSSELVDITGASEPSGRPWTLPVEPEPAARRPRTGQAKGRRKGSGARTQGKPRSGATTGRGRAQSSASPRDAVKRAPRKSGGRG